MAANDDLIALIDQRIRAAMVRDRAAGTVVARNGANYDAQVIFDGSTVSMPVKVPPHVNARENDRVLLERYGSDWVVTNSFGRPGLGEGVTFEFQTSGAETDAVYSDLPGSPEVNCIKAYDATALRVTVSTSMYVSNAGNTTVELGARIRGIPGTATASTFTPFDQFLTWFIFNTTGINLPVIGTAWVTGLPAGDYLVTARWRRPTGTGNLNVDSNNVTWVEAWEVHRAHG